jgi:hypothetical protein
VCYLGIMFKQDHGAEDSRRSSCGAQMFLDSGDALVFKSTGGPWYSESTKSFHLSESAAKSLTETAVKAYRDRMDKDPDELFIHGKARFNDDEWKGFLKALLRATSLGYAFG